MNRPQVGSVWIRSFPYYSAHQLLTVLALGNSIQCGVPITRVLLLYSNGNINEESWSSSDFHLYTLIYPPPEERGVS